MGPAQPKSFLPALICQSPHRGAAAEPELTPGNGRGHGASQRSGQRCCMCGPVPGQLQPGAARGPGAPSPLSPITRAFLENSPTAAKPEPFPPIARPSPSRTQGASLLRSPGRPACVCQQDKQPPNPGLPINTAGSMPLCLGEKMPARPSCAQETLFLGGFAELGMGTGKWSHCAPYPQSSETRDCSLLP